MLLEEAGSDSRVSICGEIREGRVGTICLTKPSGSIKTWLLKNQEPHNPNNCALRTGDSILLQRRLHVKLGRGARCPLWSSLVDSDSRFVANLKFKTKQKSSWSTISTIDILLLSSIRRACILTVSAVLILLFTTLFTATWINKFDSLFLYSNTVHFQDWI